MKGNIDFGNWTNNYDLSHFIDNQKYEEMTEL